MMIFDTVAGASARHMYSAGSLLQSTMSILSPRSSCTTACTRVPRMPTQAPTGSTSRSLEVTAIFARPPGSRAAPFTSTMPSDLGHLLLEELDQQPRVGAREDDLRPLAGELDVEDVGADAVALAVALARDLLLLGEDGVGAPQVHDDVFLLEALHDAGEELALAPLELVVDDIALGVAHALDDVLLRGLGGDAPELLGRELGEQLVADLGLRVDLRARHLERHLVLGVLDVLDHRLDLEQLDLPQVGVELGLDVLLVAERFMGRRQHRFLERLHDDAAVDTLLLAHLLDDAVQVRLHGASLTLRACGGPAGRLKSWSTWALSITPSAMATRPASGSSSVISSAVAASSVPRNRRRPPIGARVCTQTRSPSARW